MTKHFDRQFVDLSKIPAPLIEKWPGTILGEGFIPFPKKLLRVMGKIFTSPQAVEDLSLVLAIIDYRRVNVSRNPSIEYLCFISGLTVDAANQAIERLKQQGLCEVETHVKLGVLINIDAFFNKITQLAEAIDRAGVEDLCE